MFKKLVFQILEIIEFLILPKLKLEGISSRYLFIHKISFFLKKITIKKSTEIFGYKFFLDKNDSLNLSHNSKYNSEIFMEEVIRSIVNESNHALDIGAHIGYYSILLSKLVGEKGKVFTFEPSPTNFEILSKNITVNNIQNIIAVNKAVSNKNGKVKFYPNLVNSGDGRIIYPNSNYDYIEVESVALDNFFKDYPYKFDFIKIDIQGAEYLALEGMEKLLNNSSNVKIITEFTPELIFKFINPTDLLKRYVSLGFEISYIDEINKNIKKISVTDAFEIAKANSTGYINILLTKI